MAKKKTTDTTTGLTSRQVLEKAASKLGVSPVRYKNININSWDDIRGLIDPLASKVTVEYSHGFYDEIELALCMSYNLTDDQLCDAISDAKEKKRDAEAAAKKRKLAALERNRAKNTKKLTELLDAYGLPEAYKERYNVSD